MSEATSSRLRIRHVNPGKLKPWGENPRLNDKAIGPVVQSIKRFGFNVPILCNSEFRIIAGHTRLEAAKRLRLDAVPVLVLSLDAHEQGLFAISENRSSELADWDSRKLRAILDELHAEDVDLSGLGFSSAELRRLLSSEMDREDVLPPPATPPRTKPETIWKLGPHRLLCGDSRHKKTFTRLLGNARVDHVFTSPPFLGTKSDLQLNSHASHLRDMDMAISRCHERLEKGGILVWNIGNSASTHHAHVVHHAGLLEENGFRFIDMIIWVKSAANYRVFRHGAIKRSNRYYPAHQWDVLHVYQKPGEMPRMSAEGAAYMWRNHTDVWNIAPASRNVRDLGHPGVCPVELPYRTIQAYTAEGGCILDPFAGSGTVLIAAERLGRKAFLVELDPRFCDVAVKRWEQFTGKKAQRCRS